MKYLVSTFFAFVAATQLVHAQYTFGPQVQTAPSAGIAYDSGTGAFQYTDTSGTGDSDAYVPLTGTAATYITTSTGWTATLAVNLAARKITNTGSKDGDVGMGLAVFSNSLSNHIVIELEQVNNTDGGDTSDFANGFYGTAAKFAATTNGNSVATTQSGNSIFGSEGDSYLQLSGGILPPNSSSAESISAATGVVTLTYNASTETLTGYYNGTPVGSYSITGWGTNPPLTLVVAGNSGSGADVPAGTDKASDFNTTSGEPTDVSSYGIGKEVNYNQSSASAPVLDPVSPYQFFGDINPGTNGALFTSATSLTPPGPGTGAVSFLTGPNDNGPNGSTSPNALSFQENFTSKAALDAAFPSGTGAYNFAIQTTTPNSYTDQLSFGADNYPAIPQIMSVTNATWSGGRLVVTDIAQPVTITYNNPDEDGSGVGIWNTNLNSGTCPSTPTSITLPANSLSNNTFYTATIDTYSNGGGTGSTDSGTIPGAYGVVSFSTQVLFTIQTGTPTGSTLISSILKYHFLAQTSNSAPVDATGDPNDFYSGGDYAPYSMWMISATSGTVTGPDSASFPLSPEPDNGNKNQGDYENLSGPLASQAALDAAYPDGTYTLPSGVQVSLTGDDYPVAPQILTVNGETPAWDSQGHLVLDPTVGNTIVWSTATIPNFATNGHEEAFFYSLNGDNFNGVDLKAGAAQTSTASFTTLTVPANTMTPGNIYNGFVEYDAFSSVNHPSASVYNVAGYKTMTRFSAIASYPPIGLSQTITFPAIANQTVGATPFALNATASSGLAVSYSVVSGPATLSGPNNDTVTLTGAGTVVIEASQAGNGAYGPAANVTKSFTVGPGTAIVTLGNLTATYNGTPQSATATTSPSGLDVTFTYNGKTTLPVAAGSYAVAGTVNDPNYHGSATGTLVIAKAAVTVTLNSASLNATYTGKAIAVTATTTPPDQPVTFTYTQDGKNASPLNAGQYDVTATVNTANAAGSTTGTLTIAPEPVTVTFGNLTPIYTGKPIPATASTTVTATGAAVKVSLTIAYSGTAGSSTPPTAVGGYLVTATTANPNYSGSASGTLVIEQPVTFVTSPASPTPLLSAAGAQVGTYITTGGIATTAYYEYSTSESFTTFSQTPSQSVSNSKTAVLVSGFLGELQPGVTYYYRLVTVSAAGTYDSAAQSFTPLGFDTTLVAASSTAAPGTGSTFATFGTPVVNAIDGAAFYATLTVGGGVTSTTNDGIWADNSGGTLQLVAQTGSSAPGTAAFFQTLNDPVYNDNCAVAFRGTLKVATGQATAATSTGVWTNDSGSMSLVAREGGAAAGTGSTFASFTSVGLTASAGPVFYGTLNNGGGITSANNAGIWEGDTAQTLALQLGQVIGGKTITKLTFMPAETYVNGQTRSFNATGDLVCPISFSGGAGFAEYLGGVAQLGRTTGEVADTISGATYSAFGNPAINNNDHIAYEATITGTGITSANNATVFADNSGGTRTLIAQSGIGTAPGATAMFTAFSDPVINNNEAVAFRGMLKVATGQATSTTDLGIWATGSNASGLALVARQGSAAPGCPTGATFAAFTGLALPDVGGAVILGTLNTNSAAGVTGSNNTGIWAVDNNGHLQLIVRTGDNLNGKTVTALSFFPSPTYVNGQDRSFSAATGDLAYLATFSDRSTAIFNVVFP